MTPTYEELFEMVRMLSAANFKLQEANKHLQKRIKELEERLGLDSQNSSKPPSTDKKKNKQAPRGGAKKGHSGHHRAFVSAEQVSKVIIARLTECPQCGSSALHQGAPQIIQQVELPEIRPFVTQIELEKATCLCCQRNVVAQLPKEYNHGSFGPRLIGFIGVCSAVYRMSKRTIQTLLKTLCGIEISLGSIPAMERRISAGLQPAYDALAKKVNERKVGYVDETAFRQRAKTHYVWTVTTKHEAFIRILPTRGLDSLDQIRPRAHKGITVTDRYQAYAYTKHQYCLAHIHRDFKKFAQRDGPDGEFGKRALFELNEIFEANRLACHETMGQRIAYRKGKLKDILYDALANGSDNMSRFAERLLDQFHKMFLFVRDREIDCTNNAAERTLRHIVLWRKTSYGTQSAEGSRFLERAISIWMTLKKQGREVLPFFQQAYQATFQPGAAFPTI